MAVATRAATSVRMTVTSDTFTALDANTSRAVVVAKLVERSLPTPEIRG